MKKILQVLGSLQRGGAETMIVNIYNNINLDEYQFDFLVKDRVTSGYEEEVEKLGAKIFCVESAKKIGTYNYIKQQKKIIENGNYDVVHCNVNVLSGLTLLAAWLAGVKVRICHSHSTEFKNSKIMIFVGKFLIHLFSNVRIACGQQAGESLFKKDKFQIVTNGIQTQKYFCKSIDEVNECKRKLNFDDNKINVCHAGRFVDVKNQKFILELANKLNNFNFHFLGDGELLPSIKNQAKQMNLKNVFFYGSVDNVNDFLKASDIFLLPSKYEGLPVSLIEAQCIGIKSFVSDAITREVDMGVNLLTFLPLDVSIWISELSEYNIKQNRKNDINILKKISEKGYSIEDSVKKISEIYSKKN